MHGHKQPPPAVLLAERVSPPGISLGRYFTNSGWSCKQVDTPEQSLQALRTQSFDVVISDLNLPAEDLLNFLKEIKDINSEQACIVVSADCSADQVIEFFRHGARDFLPKPLDLDTLEQAIVRVVEELHNPQRAERWFGFVKTETVRYEFKSSDLAQNKLPLWIADKLLLYGRIDLTTCLKLKLAFDEALTNSLEHGNLELDSRWKEEIGPDGVDRYSATKKERLSQPNYADRKIKIDFEFDSKALTIKIEDQGKGFKHDRDTQKPGSDQSPLPHGRGLGIIHSLMSEVCYEQGGRVLIMRKILP